MGIVVVMNKISSCWGSPPVRWQAPAPIGHGPKIAYSHLWLLDDKLIEPFPLSILVSSPGTEHFHAHCHGPIDYTEPAAMSSHAQLVCTHINSTNQTPMHLSNISKDIGLSQLSVASFHVDFGVLVVSQSRL